MVTRIVQVGAMKTLSLATVIVGIGLVKTILSTIATTAVAFSIQCFVVRRTNRCVRTAVIWTSPYAEVIATIRSHTQRTRTGGLALVAPRSVFCTQLDAMGYLIAMMVAMKIPCNVDQKHVKIMNLNATMGNAFLWEINVMV